MKTRTILITIVVLVSLESTGLEQICRAQSLFGERTLGRSLSRRSSPRDAAAQAGSVDAGRRFLRGERTASDFVGAATGTEAAEFVGGTSAATTALSSVVGLREEVRGGVNRPRIPRASGLYSERLRPSQDLQDGGNSGARSPAPLSESVQSFIQSHSLTIVVSEEDRSATLRGAVPSERDRLTVELLVMFEPAIQTVVNELTVDPTLPPLQQGSPRRSPSSLPRPETGL